MRPVHAANAESVHAAMATARGATVIADLADLVVMEATTADLADLATNDYRNKYKNGAILQARMAPFLYLTFHLFLILRNVFLPKSRYFLQH